MKITIVPVAFLVVGCAVEPAPSDSQLTEDLTIIPPVTVVDNLDILQPDLQRFAPMALVDPAGGHPIIELHAVGKRGLDVRRWFSGTKKWGCDWYGFGHDAGLADPVAIASDIDVGWDNAMTVWKPDPAKPSQTEVAFGARFQGGSARVALHTLDLSARTKTSTLVASPMFMSTQTGAFDGSAFRLFGDLMTNGFPAMSYHFLDIPLEDMLVPPASTPSQHPAPNAGSDVFDQVVVGPGSAASLSCPNGSQLVTAIADTLLPADPAPRGTFELAQNGVYLFSSGTYHAFGAPSVCDDPFFCPTPFPAAGGIFGGPLIVPFNDEASGTRWLNVLVTARDNVRGSRQYRLYDGTAMDCDFGQPVWNAFGVPPDVGDDVPFVMTSSVSWHDGRNQRINVFGYTQHDNAKGLPGRLVSLTYDGGLWWWDATRTAPDGGDFVTASSAVIDQESFDRIAVYGRSSTGRIWELSYTITNGTPSGWKWTDLTRVDKYCPVFQIP